MCRSSEKHQEIFLIPAFCFQKEGPEGWKDPSSSTSQCSGLNEHIPGARSRCRDGVLRVYPC